MSSNRLVQEATAELFEYMARVDDELRRTAFVERGWTDAEFAEQMSRLASETWAGSTRRVRDESQRRIAESVLFISRN